MLGGRLVSITQPSNTELVSPDFGQVLDLSEQCVYQVLSGFIRVLASHGRAGERVLATLGVGAVFGSPLIDIDLGDVKYRASADTVLKPLRPEEHPIARLVPNGTSLWTLEALLNLCSGSSNVPSELVECLSRYTVRLVLHKGEPLPHLGNGSGFYILCSGELDVSCPLGAVFRAKRASAVRAAVLLFLGEEDFEELAQRFKECEGWMERNLVTFASSGNDAHDEQTMVEQTETGSTNTKVQPGRRIGLVRQIDENDCGVACLAMVARYYSRDIPLAALRQRVRIRTSGTNLRALCDAASALGLRGTPLKVSRHNINTLPLPAILHWRNRHFVVLSEVTDQHAMILDPASGVETLSRAELNVSWNGHAAIFEETGPSQAYAQNDDSWNWFLHFFRAHIRTLIMSLGLALVVVSATLLLPILTQVIVDHVVLTGSQTALPSLALGMLIIFVTLVGATFVQSYLTAFVAIRIDGAVLDDLTNRLLRLPSLYFRSRLSGDIQRRLDGVREVRELILTDGVGAFLGILQIVMTTGFLALYSSSTALIYLCTFPAWFLIAWMARRHLRPIFSRLEQKMGEYRGEQLEVIKGLDTVKVCTAENQMAAKLLNHFFQFSTEQFRAYYLLVGYRGLTRGVTFLGTTVVFLYSAQLAMAGQSSIGALLAVVTLVGLTSGPVESVFAFWERLQLADVQMNRLSDILSEPSERQAQHTLIASRFSGRLDVDGLTFAYPATPDLQVLTNVCFHVAAGTMTAIVGMSGSGKSTLAMLLVSLFPPSEGRIRFDGVDGSLFERESLRQQIGFVLQETHLFPGTVAENIALGSELDMPMVVAVAELADAAGFITGLPLAYNTRIGEGGIGLSGGQRQRLALARALYDEPSILILDEATSALDAETERRLQANLTAAAEGRTLIVIAHRLSTIRNADQILVLSEGEVIEHGTHETLLAKRGTYASLVGSQLEGQ